MMYVFVDLCKSVGKLREYGGRDIIINLFIELNGMKIFMMLVNFLFYYYFFYEKIYVNNINKYIDYYFLYLIRLKKKKNWKIICYKGLLI